MNMFEVPKKEEKKEEKKNDIKIKDNNMPKIQMPGAPKKEEKNNSDIKKANEGISSKMNMFEPQKKEEIKKIETPKINLSSKVNNNKDININKTSSDNKTNNISSKLEEMYVNKSNDLKGKANEENKTTEQKDSGGLGNRLKMFEKENKEVKKEEPKEEPKKHFNVLNKIKNLVHNDNSKKEEKENKDEKKDTTKEEPKKHLNIMDKIKNIVNNDHSKKEEKENKDETKKDNIKVEG